AEGYGGVVVRPSFFDASFREIPPVLWAVDDVWISGNLARRGVPILAVADAAQLRFMAEHHAPDALHQVAIEGAARFEANRRCALWMQEHLGVWR
ncbi:MAG: glycosyltransferase family 2 protein, partial [Gemmobacter sp.]